MAHAAAESDEPAPVERRLANEHARSEAHEARGAVGLPREDPAHDGARLAEREAVARTQAEPGEQRFLDHRAVIRQQVDEPSRRLRLDGAVQRIRAVHRLHLDEQRPAGGAPRHADELAGVGERRARRVEPLDGVSYRGRRRTRRAHLHVAAEQGLRLPRERARELDGEATDAHERGDAEGDAHEDGEHVTPAGAGLAPGHRQGEAHHVRGSARLLDLDGPWPSIVSAPTMRPSRSAICRSA